MTTAGACTLLLVLTGCAGEQEDPATATAAPTPVASQTEVAASPTADEEPAPAPSTEADDVAVGQDEESVDPVPVEQLCTEYEDFLADSSAEAAATFLHPEDPLAHPTGVAQTLQDLADGIDVDVEPVIGYWDPVCFPEEFADEGGEAGEGGAFPATVEEACLALADAWELDDRAAAEDFSDPAALDELFANPFEPPAGSSVRLSDVGDCFLIASTGIADVQIADSDLEAFVTDLVWYPGDTFFDDEDRSARFDEAS